HEFCRTHPLIDTDRRSKLLQLRKLHFILLHRHRALGQTQELIHPLVTNMPRKIFLTKNPEKFLPSDTCSILEDSAKCRVPPSIGIILKSESSKFYLLLLSTSDGSKNLLNSANPSFSHIRVTLSLKRRRPQPAKPIQHGFPITTIRFRGSRMIRCTSIAILSLESRKHLCLHMHHFHHPREGLEEITKIRWRRRNCITSTRN